MTGVKREEEQHCKIFVGGLDYNTTDDMLKSYFERWGEIVDHVVVKDSYTKKPRGFGFVTFKDPQSVDAVQAARPHTIDNREVETKRAVPREMSGKPDLNATVKKIFVGGIGDETTEETLSNYFSSYGNIQSVSIVTDKQTGAKRGFAFVEFEDYDPVDKIVLIKHHYINGKRTEVKKALSKQEMSSIQTRGGFRGGNQRGGGGWNQGGNQWQSGSYNSRPNYNDYGGSYGGGDQGSFSRDVPANNFGNYSKPYQGDGYSADGNSGNNWSNTPKLGSNYGNTFGGGPVKKEEPYSTRGQGPYGGGYGDSGGYSR